MPVKLAYCSSLGKLKKLEDRVSTNFLILIFDMPNKHTDKYRHKFKKAAYKVTNWPEYGVVA